MDALIFLLGLLAVAGFALLSWYLKERRRNEMGRMARQLGLSFAASDPFGLLGLPFTMFAKGDGRGLENVLHGTWQGLPLKAFDYWYFEESTDSDGRRSRTYHRFNCAIAEVEAALSPVRIGPENLLTRMADSLGFRDVEFESEDFNRRFQVTAGDRKFANDLIDARMMRWLMIAGDGWSYEAVGRWVMVSCKRVRPTRLVPLLGTLKGFVERVPRVVYSLYGLRPSG